MAKIYDMAKAVADHPHTSEDMRVSAHKVMLADSWNDTRAIVAIAHGEVEKVTHHYHNLVRSGHLVCL